MPEIFLCMLLKMRIYKNIKMNIKILKYSINTFFYNGTIEKGIFDVRFYRRQKYGNLYDSKDQ